MVVSTYNTFWSLYATHLGHKRTQLIGYLTNMSSFLTLYRTPGPVDSEAERERRIRRALSGLGPDPEMTVPLALEKYSAGLDAAFDSVKASIEAQTKVVKDRWVLNPPLPRYSYIAPEPAEDDVPSDFKTMRRWMDATKRLCENEAYFSAASAYGLGGAGSYWNSSSSGDEKNKVG